MSEVNVCPVWCAYIVRQRRTRDAQEARVGFMGFATPQIGAELRISLQEDEELTVNSQHVQSMP